MSDPWVEWLVAQHPARNFSPSLMEDAAAACILTSVLVSRRRLIAAWPAGTRRRHKAKHVLCPKAAHDQPGLARVQRTPRGAPHRSPASLCNLFAGMRQLRRYHTPRTRTQGMRQPHPGGQRKIGAEFWLHCWGDSTSPRRWLILRKQQ